MVYIMTTAWFPAQQAKAFGKKVLEGLKKFPEDKTIAKDVFRGGVAASEEGIKVITLVEVVKGQIGKALARTNEAGIWYAEGIDGYKYKIETLMSAAEAMGAIGLKMPED